ncbi:hypothetical protein [Flavobacterium kingsejongi]|uniref:Sugar-binding protein n=1 Tax=Flavobacterium kingsejongi TaxID=1678728 RepID=A0A2S1LP36_9FLAO|nr:hypothetical protein [Flavobacterium kingsejongi]AWG25479.1 hypothetical protein FK004_09640 [Flavobacterium kingsejongi]
MTPKKFASPDYEEFDLVGKVKKCVWQVWDYDVIGTNTDLYSGSYKGQVSSIAVHFSGAGILLDATGERRAITTYSVQHQAMVAKADNVVLERLSKVRGTAIDYNDYTKYRVSVSKLLAQDAYFEYRYNAQGDLITMVYRDKDEPRHFTITYRYDTQGNWVERIRAETGVQEPIQKIIREITYY